MVKSKEEYPCTYSNPLFCRDLILPSTWKLTNQYENMKMRVCGCGRSVKASNGWVHRLLGEGTGGVSLVSFMLLLCIMGAFIFSVWYTMWEHSDRAICAGQPPTRHLLATWPWISQPSKCSKINSHSLQITQTHIFCYRSTDKDILPGFLRGMESVLEGKVWIWGLWILNMNFMYLGFLLFIR